MLKLHHHKLSTLTCHYSLVMLCTHWKNNRNWQFCEHCANITCDSLTAMSPLSRLPGLPWMTRHTLSPGRTRCTKLAGKNPTLSPHLPWRPNRNSLVNICTVFGCQHNCHRWFKSSGWDCMIRALIWAYWPTQPFIPVFCVFVLKYVIF